MWCAWEVPKRKSLRSSFEISVGGRWRRALTLRLRAANSGLLHLQQKGLDAVGTLITERPPHRTVRAAFPHTAPTSGPNGKCLPHAGQRL
jgi:hypothetical protein